MIRKRTIARECALQILYQFDMTKESIEDVLKKYWIENSEHPSDVKEFAEKLVRDTLKSKDRIDSIISKYADNWHLNRMALIDLTIMRFATCELLYMSDIPPKVTINEAVNIAKKFSQAESGKFVNGILDKINHTEKPENV